MQVDRAEHPGLVNFAQALTYHWRVAKLEA
jgi:hypothetical protein